jgi:hypothetical protein
MPTLYLYIGGFFKTSCEHCVGGCRRGIVGEWWSCKQGREPSGATTGGEFLE